MRYFRSILCMMCSLVVLAGCGGPTPANHVTCESFFGDREVRLNVWCYSVSRGDISGCYFKTSRMDTKLVEKQFPDAEVTAYYGWIIEFPDGELTEYFYIRDCGQDEYYFLNLSAEIKLETSYNYYGNQYYWIIMPNFFFEDDMIFGHADTPRINSEDSFQVRATIDEFYAFYQKLGRYHIEQSGDTLWITGYAAVPEMDSQYRQATTLQEFPVGIAFHGDEVKFIVP